MNVLQEADSITMGDRQRDYAHPSVNFERIAALWTAHIAIKHGIKVTLDNDDIAWMMVQVKQARDIATPKRDNLVDGCGYLRCIERCRAQEGIEGNEP